MTWLFRSLPIPRPLRDDRIFEGAFAGSADPVRPGRRLGPHGASLRCRCARLR